MSISLYFGLPGAGKTTMMVRNILKAKKSCIYENIYCNVHVNIPGVIYIDNDVIGKYDLRNSLICIDEATIFADSRAFKDFGSQRTAFFLEHRHYRCDIQLFTQGWDAVDKRIRVITDRVFYVYKGAFLGRWFTRCYRVPYGIIIPDPKKDGSEKLGEIVQGYCRPGALARLLSPWMYRPAYYEYFDSWECPELPRLPDKYVAVPELPAPPSRIYEAAAAFKRGLARILRKLLEEGDSIL